MLGNDTPIVLDREPEGLKVGGTKQWSEVGSLRAGVQLISLGPAVCLLIP